MQRIGNHKNLNNSKHVNNRAIKFHVGHISMYVVLYVVTLFFYLFLYGYMQYIILTVMTVLPIISILSVCFLSKRCELRLTLSDKSVTRNEKFSVGILLRNPTVMTSFDVKCRVRIENLLYQTSAEKIVEVPMVIRGESSSVIPLVPNRNGSVQITAVNMEIFDFCGLISVVVPIERKEHVEVYPEQMEITEEEKNGYYTGMSANEEDILKGNDLADTSNIREYVPGDRMKDIHWKLSAKKEVLLVKERVRMSENQMVVLLELSGSHEQMDDILKFGYNLIQVCLEDGILVRFLWCGKEKKLSEALIGSKKDLHDAFSQVYHSGIGGRQEGTREEGSLQESSLQKERMVPIAGRNPVRTYVKVGLIDQTAGAAVIENEG